MNQNILNFTTQILKNMPSDWLQLTSHRLDIYNESQAKTDFINQVEKLFNENNSNTEALKNLPTAYDYIRLGHPLSCILEWTIAKQHNLASENLICFQSQTIPILAILRKNKLENKNTRLLFTENLPDFFDTEILKSVYGYQFDLQKAIKGKAISYFEGSTIFIEKKETICHFDLISNIDFYLNINERLGSILLVNDKNDKSYISEIQHVRRRESIAMTPANCLETLNIFLEKKQTNKSTTNELNKKEVQQLLKQISQTQATPIIASSGLSMQYAIMMGLVHDAQENFPNKKIKFIVPPNCYGGTNDQARRVAASLENVEIVDLPVDGNNDMVQSIHTVLDNMALQNAVPFIITEIPTNPRVEVPNLEKLKEALSVERKTSTGEKAIEPVFILDQTFCPNVHFLGVGEILSSIKSISYASGSKFPSGGKCTAGYVVANKNAEYLMQKIEQHLHICDNEATDLQYQILALQLPSMNQRIADAYKNTRQFVNFIKETLPTAKINFVSETLAQQGFTPSVFSLDLPTKGNTDQEKEDNKRALNHKLIQLMISKIPTESKYCVSYGQLKGCYWTIPATSTQGTTKEGDKDYIARVALSANMDLDLHQKIFKEFVDGI